MRWEKNYFKLHFKPRNFWSFDTPVSTIGYGLRIFSIWLFNSILFKLELMKSGLYELEYHCKLTSDLEYQNENY